jgi:hypothetical protein
MFSPKKFCRKLRIDPQVFDKLTERIQGHPIFYNNSNNPQLPVAVQLALFLNGISHYGNAAMTEDVADWAGVSVGCRNISDVFLKPFAPYTKCLTFITDCAICGTIIDD